MNKTILLDRGFDLNKPADISVIQDTMKEYDFTIPVSYVEFLLISNGLYAENFVLLEAEEIFQRNKDYEIDLYLPEYIIIGDDNGGIAILMEFKTGNIYANGLGSLLPEDLKFQSKSLEEFLLNENPSVKY
ncbi:SMI1/KNR4 family protein [Pelistega sp. NLN82]|uniref:SMI1/KNR4 family protein n=1 Tax=Pelistega ratti TaxID=2652177 RepID=A0A6L9Y4T1_9BURK|nr:SMI1/KNR4 family protein [Pelistega ratti]NEN75482.1 SMI1/KNR4 family protein [Pelistega ratti]